MRLYIVLIVRCNVMTFQVNEDDYHLFKKKSIKSGNL